MTEEGRRVLGEYVRQARVKKFGTVDAARIAAGISRTTWDKIEQGKFVRDYMLEAVCQAFDWPSTTATRIVETGELPTTSATIRTAREGAPEERLVDWKRFGKQAEIKLLDEHGLPVDFKDQVAFRDAVRALVATHPGDLLQLVATVMHEMNAAHQQDEGPYDLDEDGFEHEEADDPPPIRGAYELDQAARRDRKK